MQERQGYCLLLDVEEMEYSTAKLSAVFYAQDCTGLWREIEFAAGALREFRSASTDGCSIKRAAGCSV